MKMFKFLTIWILACFGFYQANAQELTQWVNPFIGSTNYGTTNPGAVVPRGMVSVVPFNVTGSKANVHDKDAGWWSTPYSWDNNYFAGFSHVNLSGVGCPELGVIIVMPTTGKVSASVGEYGSVMEKQTASPGFYSNYLSKYKITTEVTATKRAGLSKFIFPAGQSNVLIDLGLGLTNESGAMLKIVNNSEIEGWRMTGTFCYNNGSERPVYFVARFSKPAKSFGAWKKMPDVKAESAWTSTNNKFKYYEAYQGEMSGDSIGAYLSFETADKEEVMVKVGVSYVSITNARQNLDAEIPDFDFAKVKENARKDWESALSKIIVSGGTDDQKKVFYTALYHINIHPNILNDVNGEYPLMEKAGTGKVTNGDRYTVFSLWDTYRNFHPFLSLVSPGEQLDMVRSMVEMYKESGWMPKWELNSKETYVMEGDPAIPVIVDTWMRGLRDFDVKTAYEAMYKSATMAEKNNKLRPDNDDYLAKGYVPFKKDFDASVSHALEYYIADWNLAQMAKALGKTADYERFLKQSLRYKEYFDAKEFKILRPKKADGTFLTPFDPLMGKNFEPVHGYHEGTAWQYTFYVPHDVLGLMQLMGGSKKFTSTLQKFFDDKLFDMGNEPDINYPYLFNYCKGEEWRAQAVVDRLLKQYFKNSPDGLPGNDDCGTMSAWATFSMMGLYPVCPGNTDFALIAPSFDKISIQLDPRFYLGKNLEINVHRKAGDKYVQKVLLNGKAVNKAFINHHDLVKGGVLDIYMGK
jgi:predicted alpha-1,2-mannosidase